MLHDDIGRIDSQARHLLVELGRAIDIAVLRLIDFYVLHSAWHGNPAWLVFFGHGSGGGERHRRSDDVGRLLLCVHVLDHRTQPVGIGPTSQHLLDLELETRLLDLLLQSLVAVLKGADGLLVLLLSLDGLLGDASCLSDGRLRFRFST